MHSRYASWFLLSAKDGYECSSIMSHGRDDEHIAKQMYRNSDVDKTQARQAEAGIQSCAQDSSLYFRISVFARRLAATQYIGLGGREARLTFFVAAPSSQE
jgi:hypothetical protein